MEKWRYADLSWPEIQEAVDQEKVVIQPFGSIEGHGPHLPCGVDTYIIEAVCKSVGEGIPDKVLIMPTIPYGFAIHHMDYPGTINIDSSLLIEVAYCVGKSLARHGFKKIIFANGHGTNNASLDIASKRVTMETESLCALLNWYTMAGNKIKELRESHFPGGISHAGEMETSEMMYLTPHLVKEELFESNIWESGSDFLWRDLFPPSPVNFMDVWSRISKNGTMGDPTCASAEKGKEFHKEAVKQICKFVEQFRAYKILPRKDHHR